MTSTWTHVWSLLLDIQVIKTPRTDLMVTVTCGSGSVSVPEAALLSPLTVQIKASGGRKKGWMEQEEEEIHMSDSLIYVTEREGGREADREGHEAPLYDLHVCARAAEGYL